MSQTVVTVIRVDTGLPFIASAQLVKNSDGSVSFAVGNGSYAGQEPNQYGVRHDQTDGEPPKSYQRATVSGNVVTFLTRPQDQPMVYLMGVGTAY